ncbi:MAG: hypothetical protein DCC67_01015 [Planctomycetota bacterium]|nr:MAG: hypothetical protein DCC67_01015 [Planctomycetota bacterium]
MPRAYSVRIAVFWLSAAMGSVAYVATADEQAASPRPAVIDPTILLIRDEAVRAELRCSDRQRQDLDALLAKHNRVLLAIRDVGPTGADDAARPALRDVRDQFARILSDAQRARLQGIILQAQGYDALLRPDIAAKLKLTPQQQEKLTALSEEVRSKAAELFKSRDAGAADAIEAEIQKLQTERRDRILALLSQAQTKQYAALLGEPFDLSRVRPSPAAAPQFDSIEAWINSEPLTMESLRGKVVVVHFFAFGCINCIHNYPWYKQWYSDLSGQGLVIVGVHTPETEAENDNDSLRASLEKTGLRFPVAVDKQKKTWEAWSNGIWPSVYIVDKQGRLRFWWYGELDWQGAGNQHAARRQIEQLLAE